MNKQYKGTKVESIENNKIKMEDFWICASHNYITINSPFAKGNNVRKITSIHYDNPIILKDRYGVQIDFVSKKTILTLDVSSDINIGDIFYTHKIEYDYATPQINPNVYKEAIERYGLSKKGLDVMIKYAQNLINKELEFIYKQNTYPTYRDCPDMYENRHL